MKVINISKGGQISVPAEVRKRWNTSRLTLDDRGDELVLTPAANDPIAALRGSFAHIPMTTEEMRAQARAEEREAEDRRYGQRD